MILLSYSVLSQEIRELTLEGFSEDLGKNEEIVFQLVESSCIRIGNPKSDCIEKHKFKAVSVDSNSVNISSDKTNSIIVPISQTRKADIDKDNVFDLTITLNGIRGQVASVTFKSLDNQLEEFKSTTPSVPITETKPTENQPVENAQENQETPSEQQEEPKEITNSDNLGNLVPLMQKNIVIIGASILALILVIILIIIFKKKRSQEKNIW